MTSDIIFAIVAYIALLAFYWINEPHARAQDEKRRELQRKHAGETK